MIPETKALQRRCYVFYWKRDVDPQAWPAVYESMAVALAAPFRITPVIPIDIPLDRDDIAREHSDLSFGQLRGANMQRVGKFRNRHGQLAHSKPDGSDWSAAQWLQALIGELGEYANQRKKWERGDITYAEFLNNASDELADVVVYLDILAAQLGIDLGAAVTRKFNHTSQRAGTPEIQLPPGECRHANLAPVGDGRAELPWRCPDCGASITAQETRRG